jgi:TolB-like protein
MRERIACFLWALFLLMTTFGAAVPVFPAEEVQKVAILPFTMNAERDLGFLQEGILDMLSSRIHWKGKVVVIEKGLVKKAMAGHQGPVDLAYASEVGRRLGADYVLFGSLTLFGESVSIDATMASLTKNEPPVTVFSQTKGMESVIPEIDKFAQKVNAKMFERSPAEPEIAYAPQSQPAAAGPAPRSGASSLNPQFTNYHRVDVEGTSYWKSRNLKTEIYGMDIGDVDGDGLNELVLLEGTEIVVYRYQNGALARLASQRSSDRYPFVSVDVADTNGDGRAEIFASRLSGTEVTSQVLEMEGGGLRVIVKRSPWFLRVMEWPGKGRILLGQQKMGGGIGGGGEALIKNYFEPGIYHLSLSGNKLVKAEEAPLLNLPTVFVYNFAIGDLGGDETPEIVKIDRNGRLHVLTQAGEELYKSTEYFGGTLNFIVTNPPEKASGDVPERDMYTDYLYIPGRIVIADLDRNGKNEVIVNQNVSWTLGLTERFKAFSDGKIVSLSWNGLSLDPNWESRKLSGCLADFQIKDFENNGKPDLVTAMIQSQGISVFQKARSMVVSYRLKSKEG